LNDQRLAFTGPHFGDFAMVEDDAAVQLHVEVTYAEETAVGFADHGEGFDEQVVRGRALGYRGWQ
jgi:hypothetical protein